MWSPERSNLRNTLTRFRQESALSGCADVVGKDGSGISIDFVQHIVLGKHSGSQFLALLLKCLLGKLEHGEHLGYHLFKTELLDQLSIQCRFMAVEGKAGDAFCKVAQTLQVRIDFEHGKHKAQVDGNGGCKGQ